MNGKLYYDLERPRMLSNLMRMQAEARQKKTGKSPAELRALLEKQDTYTLHRPVRKTFAHNPYCLNNIMNVSECDFVDVQGLSIYNDMIKYLLSYKIFSKYLHVLL